MFSLSDEMKVLFANYLEQSAQDSISMILVYPPCYYESHAFMKNKVEIHMTASKLVTQGRGPCPRS